MIGFTKIVLIFVFLITIIVAIFTFILGLITMYLHFKIHVIVNSEKKDGNERIKIPFLGSLDHLLNIEYFADDTKSRLSKLIRLTKKMENFLINLFAATIVCIVFGSAITLIMGLVSRAVG